MNLCKVLLVEDDRLNRMVIEDTFGLDAVSAELTCVSTAEDALAATRELQPGLILMDTGLPGIGGLQAVRRLRKLPQTAETAIWAITAYAMIFEQSEAIVAGCDEFIPKPLDLTDLHQRLRVFFDQYRTKDRVPNGPLTEDLAETSFIPPNQKGTQR